MPIPTVASTRRRFLGQAALATGAMALPRCGEELPKPNILWILAEDFSPDLSCYGNKQVYTPNLDRLAAQGVRYDSAFVTAPVCSAARSALMVGMYQTSVGGHNHRSHRVDGYKLPEGVRPFTAHLREHGYHTSNVKTPAEGLRVNGKTDFNYNLDEPAFDGEDWSERAEGQPFYAQINFSETHRRFKAFPERPIDPETVDLPPYYPDHPVVRKDFALYLETAQHLDVKVGKVLDRLEAEGLAEDTIVFFFGDHGRPMPRGKQFCYEGGMRIPLIVRVPAKYRSKDFNPGSANDDLISHIDFTATTLRLAGVQPPANMQGRVFLGDDQDQSRDYVVCARDRCDETVDRIRAIRDKKYKYIRNYYPERPYAQPNHYKDTSYPPLQVMRQLQEEGKLTVAAGLFMAASRPADELYDLETDPFEIRNLATSTDESETLERMQGQLDNWIRETGDRGETPENPLPDEYKLRTHIDGWMTATGILTKTEGVMRMQWNGKKNQVRLPIVVEGGEFLLRFRARSKDIGPQHLFWGTVENVNGIGNQVPTPLKTDGAWHEISARFAAEGWLVNLGLDFGSGEGTIDVDLVRLFQRNGNNLRMLRQWTFAAGNSPQAA